jgi:nitrogen-specific signal transduction histidine kinase
MAVGRTDVVIAKALESLAGVNAQALQAMADSRATLLKHQLRLLHNQRRLLLKLLTTREIKELMQQMSSKLWTDSTKPTFHHLKDSMNLM